MHQSENLLAQYGADSYLRVKRAIADLRAGRGVMVVDDENRENEGDLILSTDFLTVEDGSDDPCLFGHRLCLYERRGL